MFNIPGNLRQVVNYRSLVWPAPMALLVVVGLMASHLATCLTLMTSNKRSTSLASPTFWSLHCSLGFSITTSYTVSSRVHCLASQVFFYNLGGRFPDPATLTFCIQLKSAPLSCFQSLPPAGAVARFPTLLAVGFKCVDCWELRIKSWRKTLINHCHSRTWCPGSLFSKQSLPLLHFWDYKGWNPAGSCDVLRMPFLLSCSFLGN